MNDIALLVGKGEKVVSRQLLREKLWREKTTKEKWEL